MNGRPRPHEDKCRFPDVAPLTGYSRGCGCVRCWYENHRYQARTRRARPLPAPTTAANRRLIRRHREFDARRYAERLSR